MIIWLLLTYHWSGFDLPLIRLISPARSSPLIVHMRSRLIGARTIPPLSAMVSCSKVTHTPGAVVSWVGTTWRFPSTPRPVIKQELPWQHVFLEWTSLRCHFTTMDCALYAQLTKLFTVFTTLQSKRSDSL